MKTVRQLLSSKGYAVQTIVPGATVLAAVEAMAEHDVGSLCVIDDGELVGLVSERDYARKVILKGRASRDMLVREVMTTDLITVSSKQTVQDCMSLMTEHRIRHLPVVENGQLAGIISIGDVVKSIIEEQADTIHELEGYITGSR